METTSSSTMLDIKAILKEHAEALTQLFTSTADALKSNQDVLRSNQEVLAKVLTDSAEERRTMWSQLADDRRVMMNEFKNFLSVLFFSFFFCCFYCIFFFFFFAFFFLSMLMFCSN